MNNKEKHAIKCLMSTHEVSCSLFQPEAFVMNFLFLVMLICDIFIVLFFLTASYLFCSKLHFQSGNDYI